VAVLERDFTVAPGEIRDVGVQIDPAGNGRDLLGVEGGDLSAAQGAAVESRDHGAVARVDGTDVGIGKAAGVVELAVHRRDDAAQAVLEDCQLALARPVVLGQNPLPQALHGIVDGRIGEAMVRVHIADGDSALL